MVIGELAVVHHLKEDVEQVRVRLFDLVEQQHRVGMLVDCVRQETALVVTDIARRRADQAADRVALHIFGHVEALERNAHDRGELPGNLRLADAGRPGEEVVADRLVRIPKPGTAELDRRGKHVDRRILTEDDPLQVPIEMLERLFVVARHALRRNTSHGGNHRLDFLGGDGLLPL